MLKKICSIFFVICLVFSLTVPCFASNNYVTISVDNPLTFLDDFSNAYYIFDGSTLIVRDTYFEGRHQRNFAEFSFSAGHRYFIYQSYIGDPLAPSFYIHPVNWVFSFGTKVFSPTADGSTSIGIDNPTFIGQVETQQHLFLNIFDVTLYPDLEWEDLLPYALTTEKQLTISVNQPELLNPFLNFYSGLFHSFDYFPNLVNTYQTPFVFVVVVLAVLIVIFVVVFLIKRFTGGKT